MKFKLLFFGLLAMLGLFALPSCQAEPPAPDPVETILKADVPFQVTYDQTAEAKEWEFQPDGLLKVYALGRPADGYVYVYSYERLNDSTIRLYMKGLVHPGGEYRADAAPIPYPYDVSVDERSPDGTIRAVLRPQCEADISPTVLNFQRE
jgi:hypothetical protein